MGSKVAVNLMQGEVQPLLLDDEASSSSSEPSESPESSESPEPENECEGLSKKMCKKNNTRKYIFKPLKKCFSFSELEEIDCSAFESKSGCKAGACKWLKKKKKCINF